LDKIRPLTLDSNVFISQIKGDETYSRECGVLISRVGSDFFLVEPAIVLAEVGNAVGRNVDLRTAEDEVDGLLRLVSLITPCDRDLCAKAGLTGAEYDVYSVDSLYLQTAMDLGSLLVSLDEEFLSKVKVKGPPVEVYHIKDFPY